MNADFDEQVIELSKVFNEGKNTLKFILLLIIFYLIYFLIFFHLF